MVESRLPRSIRAAKLLTAPWHEDDNLETRELSDGPEITGTAD